MSSALSLPTAAVVVLLLAVAPACADASSSIYAYSQQSGSTRASAGASVEASSHSPGAAGSTSVPTPSYGRSPASAPYGGESSAPATSVPVDTGSTGEPSSDSATTSVPYGGWTCDDASNRVVCAIRSTSPARIPRAKKGAAAEPSQPAVSPAALAAAAASRVSLTVGSVEASPTASAEGLTGAASWFWISPTPATRTISVSLAGEQVTVSAAVSGVQWSFGDGAGLTAGPGVSYRPGAVPAGAVRHVYETRCLPGDQGHDPYVLPSCGANGYTVAATVDWGISYVASGPVSTAGTLPSRATSTSISYPVSEVRAFLTAAGGGS